MAMSIGTLGPMTGDSGPIRNVHAHPAQEGSVHRRRGALVRTYHHHVAGREYLPGGGSVDSSQTPRPDGLVLHTFVPTTTVCPESRVLPPSV